MSELPLDAPDFAPRYMARHRDFQMSSRSPVYVWSLVYGCPAYEVLHPGQPGSPGPPWGPAQYLTSDWGNSIPAHNHDYCEIAIVRGGAARHRTAKSCTTVTAGAVLVVPKGETHALERLDHFAETHLAFIPEWVTDDLRTCWSEPGLVPLFLSGNLLPRSLWPHAEEVILTADEQRQLDVELAGITRERVADPPPASLAQTKYCLLKALIILARAFVRQSPEAAHLTLRPEVWTFLDAVELAIVDGQSVCVAEAASKCGLTPRRLDALFKEATGATPYRYFQTRRVQQGARLLLDPGNAVADVALRLGYADAPHFSNAFRRHYGMSPRAYRNLYRT